MFQINILYNLDLAMMSFSVCFTHGIGEHFYREHINFACSTHGSAGHFSSSDGVIVGVDIIRVQVPQLTHCVLFVLILLQVYASEKYRYSELDSRTKVYSSK